MQLLTCCCLLPACCTAGLQQQAPAQEGLLLACASKAASNQPLLLPPTAALAAALEARGHYASAAAALRYCLALLQAAMQQGAQGLAAVGLAPGLSHDPAITMTHQLLLVPPSPAQLEQVQVLEGSGVHAVVTAVELALARNLCLAGEVSESLALYQKLEAEGSLGGAAGGSTSSLSWLAYGSAAQQAGQNQLAVKALQTALDTAAEPRVQLAAVTALLQVCPPEPQLEQASPWHRHGSAGAAHLA
jgi:tetratricopeptide (TPR) repeat protein